MSIKTQNKLTYLDETKALIREAIEAKGQTVADSDTFRSYADKINAISASANPVLEELEVTENGNYTPSEGVDGFGSVTVNVPDIPAVVQPLEVTENGTYTAPDGVDGFSEVTVNVDPTKITVLREQEMTGFELDAEFGYAKGDPEPTFTITEGEKYFVTWDGVTYETTAQSADLVADGAVFVGNGTPMGLPGNGEPFAIAYMNGMIFYLAFTDPAESHTVGIYQSAIKEIVLQDKTITENGDYTADEGYDGLGKVTVDVAGSGGGGLPAGVYLTNSPIDAPNTYRQKRFMYKGVLYVACSNGVGDGYIYSIHKWDGSAWSAVVTSTGSYGVADARLDVDDFRIAEYNGKLHIFSGKYHAIFDGTNVTASTALPTSDACPVVYQDKLWVRCTNNKVLYEWDKTNSAWNTVATFDKYYDYPVVVNGDLYFSTYPYKLYKYEGGSLVELGATSNNTMRCVVLNGNLYYFASFSSYCRKVMKFDFSTNTETEVGRIPYFSEVFWSQGTNDMSFYVSTASSSKSSYVDRYPFLVATIIEATE